MRKIVLASHGGLADGMLNSVRMIYGTCVNKMLVSEHLLQGEDVNILYEKYKTEVTENPDINYILVTDIKGGSINTCLLRLLVFPNVELISGMNMGLILQLVMEEGDGAFTEEQSLRIIEEARQGIEYHNDLPEPDMPNADF